MKHLARCTPDCFADLATVCALDARFPKTESLWNNLIAEADAEAAAHGPLPAVLVIDSSEFRRWCALVGIVPGIDALKAYAIVQRAPQSKHAQG